MKYLFGIYRGGVILLSAIIIDELSETILSQRRKLTGPDKCEF